MTIDISDNDPRISYTANANGAQTVFAVPFEFFDNTDLKVYVAGVLKSEGTGSANYGVSGGAGSTGTVTFVSGVTASATVVITRSITIERVTDFTAGADINRAALNTQLDTLTAIAADLKDTAGRALQLTDFDAAASLVLPAVDDRKGKVLAFNETSGAVEAGPSTSAVQTVANNAAAVNLIGTADAISDINDLATSTNISNISSVAGIASNISTVAGIASNVTSVAGDATDIGAVAGKATEIGRLGTADAVADLALLGTSTVVADIATVAGVASTMSAAASNASAAAASATAAANSAAAAATALDSFDDRYLGSKSSEPSVDNDGNALVSGALYFNSTSNGMKVYDGGSWINASSAGAVSLLDYEYTATAGQTTFSGSDNNSATLAYAVGNLIVTLNGIVLDNGSDYTATSGTSIVLASGAALNDHLAVVAFKSFTVADAVAASTGGTFAGDVTVSGTLTATAAQVNGNIATTGTVDGRDVAADGTKLDTNIPASLGTAGQILTVNAGATAGEWADLNAGFLANVVNVTSNTTVTTSQSGTVFVIKSTTAILTLPAPAVGLYFGIVNETDTPTLIRVGGSNSVFANNIIFPLNHAQSIGLGTFVGVSSTQYACDFVPTSAAVVSFFRNSSSSSTTYSETLSIGTNTTAIYIAMHSGTNGFNYGAPAYLSAGMGGASFSEKLITSSIPSTLTIAGDYRRFDGTDNISNPPTSSRLTCIGTGVNMYVQRGTGSWTASHTSTLTGGTASGGDFNASGGSGSGTSGSYYGNTTNVFGGGGGAGSPAGNGGNASTSASSSNIYNPNGTAWGGQYGSTQVKHGGGTGGNHGTTSGGGAAGTKDSNSITMTPYIGKEFHLAGGGSTLIDQAATGLTDVRYSLNTGAQFGHALTDLEHISNTKLFYAAPFAPNGRGFGNETPKEAGCTIIEFKG